MESGGEDWLGWSLDGVAAGLLGAATGVSALWLGHPLAGVAAAAAMTLAALALLRQVKPAPRRFRLPAFTLAAEPLADAPAPDILELTDVAAPEPLLLTDALEPPTADNRVVSLFGARPLPTPGELSARIDAHLGARERDAGATVLELEVDAAAALRQALGDLRRSLG